VTDFGERLMDIRDRLEGPLPIRITPWRIYVAIALESFAAGLLVIWQRRYVPSVDIGQWLPPPQADLQEVVDAFATLRHLQPSGLQSQQANQLFMEQLERRHERYAIELDMWWTTANSASFLGNLLFTLLSLSVALCVFDARLREALIVACSLFLAQTIVAMICINRWHRWL